MSILGITNRTENWKTARCFSPMFIDDTSRLNLARKLGEPDGTQPDEVHIELFWYGMRDYFNTKGGKKKSDDEDLAERYACLFPKLRKKVRKFQSEEGQSFRDLKPRNYDMSTKDRMTKLASNLYRTEIDVVLETPSHLFIGEAKGETGFGGKGGRALPHQLIREYVMARILVDRLESNKEVFLFVVRNELKGREQVEVDFMVNQGWLKEENILTWDCIKALAHDS